MSWKCFLLRRVSVLTCLPQKRNTDSEIIKPTYPVTLPHIWGDSNCRIIINALNPRSSDTFQRVMILQRAALIINHCAPHEGGFVSLGPREQFQVQVIGSAPRATS